MSEKEQGIILKLNVECVSWYFLEEPCIRVIEIHDHASLYDLHEAIQDAVDFDRDHPFGFYVANSASTYAKKRWIGSNEDWGRAEAEMMDTELKSIYPLGRQKLYYLFDFGDNWLFEIRKARGAKKSEPGVTYPRVIESIGPDPDQYPAYDDG